MRKIGAWAAIAVGAVWWILNVVGNLQTAQGLFQNRGETVRAIGIIMTSQWLPLGLFLLGVTALVYIHWRTWREKENISPIKIDIVPNRWASPVLVTIINTSHDYPAHIKTSRLFGIKADGMKEELQKAWTKKFGDCAILPYSLPPDRQIQLAYPGHFPFTELEGLVAELELENGQKVVSPTIPPPKPPG